jgi:two-component system, response regulator, stage 0 sporulation protein F
MLQKEERMNRVLVVCNEESLRILYSEELMEEGYEVMAACAGDRRVIGFIEEIRPDVILMDIGSDKMSGLDLLRDVKDIFGDLPVLFCTAASPSNVTRNR